MLLLLIGYITLTAYRYTANGNNVFIDILKTLFSVVTKRLS